MSKDKKKKEKIRYIDDGRTIADMSNVGRKRPTDSKSSGRPVRQAPNFKDCARTYWESVKLMFIPCMVTIGIIGVAFLILWLIATLT